MVLPVSYLLLKFGDFEPEAVFYVIIIASAIAQVFRVYFMKKQLGMDVGMYCVRVLSPVLMTTIVPALVVATIAMRLDASFVNLVIVTLVSVVITTATIAICGLTASERKSIIQTIKTKIKG